MWSFFIGSCAVRKLLALFSDFLSKDVFQNSFKLKNPARQVSSTNNYFCLDGRELMTFLKVST